MAGIEWSLAVQYIFKILKFKVYHWPCCHLLQTLLNYLTAVFRTLFSLAVVSNLIECAGNYNELVSKVSYLNEKCNRLI